MAHIVLRCSGFVSCVYSVLIHGLCLWNPFACKFSTFPPASNPYHDTYTVCHQSDEMRANLSEWIYLVLYDCLCLCVCVSGWQRLTHSEEETEEGAKKTVCVCVFALIVIHLFLYIIFFLSNPICSFRSSRKFLHL